MYRVGIKTHVNKIEYFLVMGKHQTTATLCTGANIPSTMMMTAMIRDCCMAVKQEEINQQLVEFHLLGERLRVATTRSGGSR